MTVEIPDVQLVENETYTATIDGEMFTSCADVESIIGWYEVEAAEGEAAEQDYAE